MNILPPLLLVIALIVATVGALSAVGAESAAPASQPIGSKRIVGYFTEWGGEMRGYHVADIPADRLTHVLYAFARIRDGQISIHNAEAAVEKRYPGDGGDDPAAFRGHFRQLQLLKQEHPHLRTLISVGGWGGSGDFSDVALTEASREKFAVSCAAFVSRYRFDGVDIDWEFPVSGGGDASKGRPEDRRNFTLLLRELRRQLERQGEVDGKRYLLTIAAPAGPHNIRNIELEQIHAYLDWINLMTYDFAGSWSKRTGFNAPLRAFHVPDAYAATAPVTHPPPEPLSAQSAVKAYLDAGVPADKIVLGVPFFGRAFGGVANVNNGLFQPHDGETPRPVAGNQWSYRTLAEHYIDRRAERFWHEDAKVPWLYDAEAKVMISYDDPESIRHKAAFARDRNLGGVMIWELSQDDEQAALLRTLHETLNSD